MIRQLYDFVMDHEKNPLSALPKMVRFQVMMALSFMWSSVFTIWVGSVMVLGPSVLAHVMVLIAVFFTADVFRRAQAQAVGHRDAMRDPRDGTVLYDDVWGG